MKIGSFFKNEKYKKIIVGVLVFLIALLVLGLFTVRAEDNKTKKIILKEWTTQLLYDTTNACYQGTIKWVIMSNPNLLGVPPGWKSQRQMLVHCFCVMDRIRKEIPIEEYQKKVFDQDWVGNTFITKAFECVKEEKTLPSFFVIQGDDEIETVPNNPIEVPEGETNDSQEESPDQKQEESEGSPQTIFQG
jgi:hypothetical protein